MNKRKIHITILYNSSVDPDQLQEVCAGLEEEGVPFLLQKLNDVRDFIQLGNEAASMSPLQVGIGIDKDGKSCVHHQKLKQEEPYLQDTLQNARRLGKNAARLVKGLLLSI
ncbi:glycerol dehydratase reactivase beta/small subunit family protein [Pseudalkalibacillus sp. R45]|uniref:glycerol dehydratase reactivase beta/small subunit family protein n=1 Tax=Pseudalkalibacillus sp. R45 TaxID=3457433 RepID=UPI003FCC6E0A